MPFYKLDQSNILIAPNFVAGPNGLNLDRTQKDSYTYPVSGWYWFDSDAEAAAYFKQPIGVESSIEIKASWRNFLDAIPSSLANSITSNPSLMLRLVRLETGSVFLGKDDKLLEYWANLNKEFLTVELIIQLNSLAAACNLPVRLNDQGDMILA